MVIANYQLVDSGSTAISTTASANSVASRIGSIAILPFACRVLQAILYLRPGAHVDVPMHCASGGKASGDA